MKRFDRALKFTSSRNRAGDQPTQSERHSESTPYAIYDSNPDHLWNRLHRALYVRTAQNGEEYGRDELDPLLWAETEHLLVGPSHQQAIKLLDEFLSVNGAALPHRPLVRSPTLLHIKRNY